MGSVYISREGGDVSSPKHCNSMIGRIRIPRGNDLAAIPEINRIFRVGSRIAGAHVFG